MDGTIVETTGQCKTGMDMSYKGIWGYHPLVLTLAETGEVLRLVNRSGNRPSQEGAAVQADQAIDLCRSAGFRKIVLRGDTAFTQTVHLDRWNQAGVKFLFGMKAYGGLVEIAENVAISDWKTLTRSPKYDSSTADRARPKNTKEQVVTARGYTNKRLAAEWVTEVPYSPTDCKESYRLVIVCKELEVTEQGKQRRRGNQEPAKSLEKFAKQSVCISFQGRSASLSKDDLQLLKQMNNKFASNAIKKPNQLAPFFGEVINVALGTSQLRIQLVESDSYANV